MTIVASEVVGRAPSLSLADVPDLVRRVGSQTRLNGLAKAEASPRIDVLETKLRR